MIRSYWVFIQHFGSISSSLFHFTAYRTRLLTRLVPFQHIYRYPEEQTSMGIRLAGGKSYYMQAVGAQSGGRDCLSVGVQMPNGIMVRPITRHFMSRAPLGMMNYTFIFIIGSAFTAEVSIFISDGLLKTMHFFF